MQTNPKPWTFGKEIFMPPKEAVRCRYLGPWLLSYLACARVLALLWLKANWVSPHYLHTRWLKKSGSSGKDVVASVNSGSKVAIASLTLLTLTLTLTLTSGSKVAIASRIDSQAAVTLRLHYD